MAREIQSRLLHLSNIKEMVRLRKGDRVLLAERVNEEFKERYYFGRFAMTWGEGMEGFDKYLKGRIFLSYIDEELGIKEIWAYNRQIEFTDSGLVLKPGNPGSVSFYPENNQWGMPSWNYNLYREFLKKYASARS